MTYHDVSSQPDWPWHFLRVLPIAAAGLTVAVLTVLIASYSPQSGLEDGIEEWHGNVARSDSLQ